jgi:hypothetical protein
VFITLGIVGVAHAISCFFTSSISCTLCMSGGLSTLIACDRLNAHADTGKTIELSILSACCITRKKAGIGTYTLSNRISNVYSPSKSVN